MQDNFGEFCTNIIAELLQNFVSNEFIIWRNNYKLHMYIHYNYSVQVMRNKKITLKEYCKIKVNIKCIFLFLLNSKTKYTF